MAATKAPDPPPVRIDDLPYWAQLAFAGRAALRLLPAHRPLANPRDRAITGFRAAQACCFIPMSSAMLDGGVRQSARGLRNRVLARRAAEEVVALGFQEGRERVVSQCLAVAGQMVAAAATAEVVERHVLGGLIAAYHDVAGTYGVYEAFEAAANADVAQLAAYALDEREAAPSEFFARPLFDEDGSIPREWQPVINEWSALLTMVELGSFLGLYLALCAGRGFSHDDIAALVDAWAKGEGLAGDDVLAQPVVEGPASSSKAPQSETPAPARLTPTLPTPTPTVTAPEAPPKAAAAAADTAEKKETAPPEPELLLLDDRPVETGARDLLGFQDYAQSLAVILNDRVATPFTMSINAPWGAGKTSLANLLEERLLNPPGPRIHRQHIVLRFNAWMHDDAPNLAAPLVTAVCRRADGERQLWKQFLQPLPAPLLEPSLRRWRRVIYAALVVVLTLVGLWQVSEHLTHVEGRQKYDVAVNETYQQATSRNPDGTTIYTEETVSQTRPRTPPPDRPAVLGPVDLGLKWLQPRLVLLGTFLTAFAGLVGVLVKLLSSTSLLSFVQSPEKAAEGGSIQAAQKTIGRLIKDATATGNRFFLFIDDIERCKPPRAIDVLDAVSQLLDHPNVVVVLLGDMSAVAAAAQVKYKDLAKIYVPAPDLAALTTSQRQEVFGRLYIQKIVQFQFDLPALSRKRIKEYVAQLLQSEDVTAKRDVGTSA